MFKHIDAMCISHIYNLGMYEGGVGAVMDVVKNFNCINDSK